MDRYQIGLDASRQFHVIFDMKWWLPVELPDSASGEFKRLEWGRLDRYGAEQWLNRCRKGWGGMPTVMSRHPMPIPGHPDL